MTKYYPKSKVEAAGFSARYYDTLLNIVSLGTYSSFIEKAIRSMEIHPNDRILDLGAGTGRNGCIMMKYLSKGGNLIGLDISEEMIVQFKRKCLAFPNAEIFNQRIDQHLPYEREFDKVFIAFVLHGFPQNIRELIIGNAFRVLRDDGEFFILDYNEFSFEDIPFYVKVLFRFGECPYAFDFIKKDWKRILTTKGFNRFGEYLFFNGYVRLLKASKFK